MLIVCAVLLPFFTEAKTPTQFNSAEQVLNQYHQAAANADFSPYFSTLHDNAIILGTDGSERWTKNTFKAFVSPYFKQGRGWKYQVLKRNVTMVKPNELVFFDEQLYNDNYGHCRGSGVVINTKQGWKILQYNLAIVVPNDIASEVVSSIKHHQKAVK